MRLDPLYTVTFTTPEAWSVEVASDAGIEGRGFLLAEGHSAGRLSARYRAANFPRKRSDGALVPEFRGVLETDDGAVILFEWQGLAVLGASGMQHLLGSLVHTTDAPATDGLTTASARLRARSALVPTDLDSTSCWRSRRWCGKGWHERGAVSLAYPHIERADHLLVADLVCRNRDGRRS
jgi:hypothetical protein